VGNFRSKDDIDRMEKYIELEHRDEDLTLPKYKLDDKVAEKNFREPEINEEDYKIEVKEWDIIKDNGFMDDEETKKYAKYLIDNYGSFNLNGKAGTGKTTLLNAIVEYLEEQKKNVIRLAPTHKAKNLINGETIHSYFLKMMTNSQKFNQVDYILVDEISMVKELFYRYFYYINDNFDNVNFIICGDFRQLAPVCDIRNYNYENSTILKQVCKYNKVELSKCRRSNRILFDLCDNVHKVKEYGFKQAVSMFNIVRSNNLRRKLNNLCIDKHISKNKIKNIVTLPKSLKNPWSQTTKFFKGIPLMGSITNHKYNIVNSEEYKCVKFDDKVATIANVHSEEVRDIPIKEVNDYLVPMYAVTVHKSQGITLRKNFTIWQWDLMDKKSKYVALSRSSDIKYINIIYNE